MSALRGLDRIDVADDVRDRDIGCGQLFDKTRIALDPVDVGQIAVQIESLPAEGRDRRKRIVVYFRTGDHWKALVKQRSKLANDAALGLAAQSKQDQVVPRQNRIDQLRDDRFIIAHDAGKQLLAATQFLDQIRPQLV